MKLTAILLQVILFLKITKNTTMNKVLSRNKRYLVFPEGSTLSIAICMTAQTGLTPGEIFTEGINWGISYDLSNNTKEFTKDLNKPKEQIQRRHRRDLYTKLEKIMNSIGYNGRSCILRVVCETARNFLPHGFSLLDEILRIVFEYPHKGVEIVDTREHQQYFFASQVGRKKRDACGQIFPECPFSLIDLALGYYSKFLGQ